MEILGNIQCHCYDFHYNIEVGQSNQPIIQIAKLVRADPMFDYYCYY